jgi:hypothetical protein
MLINEIKHNNKTMNPIEEFNRIRRIIFSTFHKGEEGQIKAFEYLEGYKKTLGPTVICWIKS